VRRQKSRARDDHGYSVKHKRKSFLADLFD